MHSDREILSFDDKYFWSKYFLIVDWWRCLVVVVGGHRIRQLTCWAPLNLLCKDHRHQYLYLLMNPERILRGSEAENIKLSPNMFNVYQILSHLLFCGLLPIEKSPLWTNRGTYWAKRSLKRTVLISKFPLQHFYLKMFISLSTKSIIGNSKWTSVLRVQTSTIYIYWWLVSLNFTTLFCQIYILFSFSPYFIVYSLYCVLKTLPI